MNDELESNELVNDELVSDELVNGERVNVELEPASVGLLQRGRSLVVLVTLTTQGVGAELQKLLVRRTPSLTTRKTAVGRRGQPLEASADSKTSAAAQILLLVQ